jgi:hypothetical protein
VKLVHAEETMSNSGKAIFLAALVVGLAAMCAAQSSASREQSNALILLFKDGHQKSFAMADVSRIELNPTRIVLKNGHQESFAAGEIVRIDLNNSAGENGVLGRNHFVGKWKVGTGVGGNFIITLNRDGEATKTIGASHGTWVLFNGEARISWDDGWRDAIRKVGSKHEKFAYEPGKAFDDEPSNVTDAQSMNPQPI